MPVGRPRKNPLPEYQENVQGNEEVKMEKESYETGVPSMFERLVSSLIREFQMLRKDIELFLEQERRLRPITVEPPPEKQEVPPPALPSSASYVPFEYRELVESILNKNFNIENEYRVDGFFLTIVVPDKYSTITQEQKNVIGGRDIRGRVIDHASGIHGVRTFCEQVFDTFSPEIKSMIVMDRTQL